LGFRERLSISPLSPLSTALKALDQTVACADSYRNPIVQLNIWMGKPTENFGSEGGSWSCLIMLLLMDYQKRLSPADHIDSVVASEGCHLHCYFR